MKIGIIEFDGFDWDIGNFIKARKLESFFEQELFYFEDKRHSSWEQRFVAVGVTPTKRTAFIAFTFRQKAHELNTGDIREVHS